MAGEYLSTAAIYHELSKTPRGVIGSEKTRRMVRIAAASMDYPILIVGIRVYESEDFIGQNSQGLDYPHSWHNFYIDDEGRHSVLPAQRFVRGLPLEKFHPSSLDFLLRQIELAKEEQTSLLQE